MSHAAAVAREAKQKGLGGIILFGLPKTKDPKGLSGCEPDGPVGRAVAAMKDAAPGHCGVLCQARDGSWEVDNGATLEIVGANRPCLLTYDRTCDRASAARRQLLALDVMNLWKFTSTPEQRATAADRFEQEDVSWVIRTMNAQQFVVAMEGGRKAGG